MFYGIRVRVASQLLLGHLLSLQWQRKTREVNPTDVILPEIFTGRSRTGRAATERQEHWLGPGMQTNGTIVYERH
jgi:hypothetical protein